MTLLLVAAVVAGGVVALAGVALGLRRYHDHEPERLADPVAPLVAFVPSHVTRLAVPPPLPDPDDWGFPEWA